MLEILGTGAGLASFVFLGVAIWRFAFWRGQRSRGWKPLGLWMVCAITAGGLLPEPSAEAKAAREAARAEAKATREAAKAEADKAVAVTKAESVGAKTLADYIDMSRSDRADAVHALMAAGDLPADDADRFKNCLGEYAPDKSPDLTLSNVFGWCAAERINAPENFAGHFNELDAPDYSSNASVVCRNIVEDKLRSPASADFPWIDDQVIKLGRHEYDIASHVDSQNGFGAMLRSRYFCRVKFKGGDSDPLVRSSWHIVHFDIE